MMNPSDISNALIYGIPIISCIGYGYESLMACRGRLVGSEDSNDGTWESALATRPNKLRLAVAESRDQIAAARALVSRRYAWRGYHGSSGDEHPSAADRSTHEVTFIVEDGKTI